jgi:DNA-binding NarL/FixJ family response regulator
MTEIYKLIPDTEGLYSISTSGNVRNNSTGYILNPFMTDRGYLQVTIQFSNKTTRTSVNVHKLVARAFISNLEMHPVVNHLDGVKTNNRATNLEWTTHAANNEHAVKMGLIASGEDSYLAILSEEDVVAIIERLRSGCRNADLSREFNVAPNTVDDIRCNRTWRYLERQPIAGNGVKRKIAAEDIPEIREYFVKGLSDRTISKKYGVAPATVNQIRHGKTWKNY